MVPMSNISGSFALIGAMLTGHCDMTKLLIENGNVNPDSRGVTPLMKALESWQWQTLKLQGHLALEIARW